MSWCSATRRARTWIDAVRVYRKIRCTPPLSGHFFAWFASIWIFTLGLPWRLGAAFFLRHLLDADPASNTCSWRWVAGLHTPGRNYVARACNIAKYTGGRFGEVHGLAAEPAPLQDEVPPPREALRTPARPRFAEPTALLILEEDCRLEEDLPVGRAVATGTLALSHLRDAAGASPAAAEFEDGALADAARRAEAAGAPKASALAAEPEALAAWAREAGAGRIATGFVPTGWARDFLERCAPAFEAAGLSLEERRRDWDAAFHPHATAGFFKVKKAIPGTLRALGLPA